jgi:nickel/cobalt transporter (NiCoT) family protein
VVRGAHASCLGGILHTVLILSFALGLRHGTDPDHLAAIDALTRLRPNTANGVFFALGHGLTVICLAVGLGHVLAGHISVAGPWTLIALGALNLWRILRGISPAKPLKRPIVVQPFVLGILLAAGFETASQLSALILAGRSNPWIMGLAFSIGMVCVDGLDGMLAASTQKLAALGRSRANAAGKVLGIVVVVFSFLLGSAELAGFDLDRFALPLGLTLFVVVLSIRAWARGSIWSWVAETIKESSIEHCN